MATKEEITVKSLLEAGAHFGHQKRRWNPKMKRYIFEERDGLYIIDLSKTLHQLKKAKSIVEDAVTNHKSILFVGTKKQAKTVVVECAQRGGEYFISERWLGGTLTNLTTIRASIKKLEKIEKQIATKADLLTKKELSLLQKQLDKLERNLSGIRAMRKPPGLIIVVDSLKEHIAVKEARKLGIPVMGLIDTNCNPDPIDYVITCNDDALKSIKLILDYLTDAVIAKKHEMKIEVIKKEKEVVKVEETKEPEEVQDIEKELDKEDVKLKKDELEVKES